MRLPVSITLGLFAMTIATFAGVAIGTLAAVRRGGVDRLVQPGTQPDRHQRAQLCHGGRPADHLRRRAEMVPHRRVAGRPRT